MKMRIMTDHEAYFGPYRPTKCEWISNVDDHCNCSPVVGKPYCSAHLKLAFRVTIEKKPFNQPLEDIQLEPDEESSEHSPISEYPILEDEDLTSEESIILNEIIL